jgi:hypothetical protein
MNTDLLGGAGEELFEAGIMSEWSISGDNTGGPARIGMKAVGKRPTYVPYTNATAQVIGTDGYFTFTGGNLKMEVDNATPVQVSNIQSVSLVVTRPVTPVATADSQSVNFLALGKVEPSFSLTLLMDTAQAIDAYRATFYGSAAGTTPSATLVSGSLELNLVHSITGTHSFKINVDKCVFQATPPLPDPAAAPLTTTITGVIQKPATGDHVKAVIVNGTSAAA